MSDTALAPYLRMWSLKAAGTAIVTPTAILQPVTCPDGRDAMLRLATAVSDDEDCTTSGADLLQAWNGHGAAQVYARKGHALLIESAVGTDSLIDMAQNGNDAAATQILCDTAARLHAHTIAPPSSLIPLDQWFRSLIVPDHTGLLATCAQTAKRLLDQSGQSVPLHGDLHHGNVLDFGSRGWLAIDPKGLLGDRAFEYAVMFTNPDLAAPDHPIAAGAFERRFMQISAAANLPACSLRDWIIAGAGLSAAWFMEDDNPLGAVPLDIAARALRLDLPA